MRKVTSSDPVTKFYLFFEITSLKNIMDKPFPKNKYTIAPETVVL